MIIAKKIENVYSTKNENSNNNSRFDKIDLDSHSKFNDGKYYLYLSFRIKNHNFQIFIFKYQSLFFHKFFHKFKLIHFQI